MSERQRTISAILDELRYIPKNDHQFDSQRSHCNTELEYAYYRYRSAQERLGWKSVPTGRGYAVYNESGVNLSYHELETVAWGIAQESTLSH